VRGIDESGPPPSGFAAVSNHKSLTRKLNMFNYRLAQLTRTERGMGSEGSGAATCALTIVVAAAPRVRMAHAFAPTNA
jgi:hypothetical protein